jgi:2-dehydro-3-deoxyphosphogalactonate aldolase
MQPELLAGAVPIIAILRGVVPERCVAVAEVLYAAGIRAIEVPLNSPDPFASIAALTARREADCVIGAGTVLTPEDVRRAYEAGGQLIVAPNCDTEVIRCGLQLGLHVVPGVATPTEAFSAIHAGATALKLFPAITYGPPHLRALRSVLPQRVRVLPVGGIGAQHIEQWLAAGAAGFGFGSELFRPDYALAEVEARARRLVGAVHAAKGALAQSAPDKKK